MRATELCNFRLSSYHPTNEFISVIGKGNKERSIPIGQSAIKWINRYITIVRNKNKVIKKGNEDFVFINPSGSKISRSNVASIVKKASVDADLKKKITPHTFRHSFATHLVQGGASLNSIRIMLGHESITSTEIYARTDIDYLRDTLECFHPTFQIKS